MMLSSLLATALAVSARWSFEDAYDNVEDGAWYIGQNNESATLAWGESYVMSALAAMFRATGHPMYLERLAAHADGVLAQRDDARGVTDYRGVSGACWRNASYQDGNYCYAVHTGMLVYPMLELVAALRDAPQLGARVLDDGETLDDKAERYLAAAQESAAFHDFEWNSAGYYRFPADAGFLPSAGNVQPLNQSNALGRVHVMLAALAPGGDDLDKATALCARMQAQITVGGDGAYLWNYAGGNYAGVGEDISHAAINVDFAVLCAAHGLVFDAADLDGFATTFMERVYVNDRTFADHVGGGSTNDGSYRAQIGRWLALAPVRTGIYTAVRDAYDNDYGPSGVGSGSVLFGWALLAEHEPKVCTHYVYVADWTDVGDAQQATAYGANVLTIPGAFERPCAVRVEVDVPRPTDVEQYDGEVYHRGATWAASAGPVVRHIPYDPRWPFAYDGDGVLFQFADAFVAGQGIAVTDPIAIVPPTIDSQPDTAAEPEVPWSYAPAATSVGPVWWSLAEAPGDADIDPATGVVSWTPPDAGPHAFTVRLDDEYGFVEQSFMLAPGSAADSSSDGGSVDDTSGGATGDAASSDDGGASTSTGGTGSDDGAAADDGASGDGCGCATGRDKAMPLVAFALLCLPRRRRARG